MLRNNNVYTVPDTTPAGLNPVFSSVALIQKVMVVAKNNKIDSKKSDALALTPEAEKKAQPDNAPVSAPAVEAQPEENISLEKVDFSSFRAQFNRHGDYIYGFREPRNYYIDAVEINDKKVQISSAMISANAVNAFLIPRDEGYQQAALPVAIEEYYYYLQSHPVKKYRQIAKRDIWTDGADAKYQILSCKALIAYTAYSGHNIHFVLDNGAKPWDFAAIARKDAVVDEYVTTKELRFIYKHYATLKDHILFWKQGRRVAAPWETAPDDWKSFQRKRRDATAVAQPETEAERNWVRDHKPPVACCAGSSCVML